MNQPLLILAKRAAADETLIAYWVDQQAKRDNLSWEQLAALLKIEMDQLAKLALCKQPREAPFMQDVAQITAYSGINRMVLLHFMDSVKQGQSIQKKTVQHVKPVYKRKGNLFMLQRRTWAIGFATLLILIVGAFVMAQSDNRSEATLVVSAGDVVVNQAGGAIFANSAETAASAGDVLTVQEGDTIRLDANASAQLRLQDGSTVDLFGGTTLAVSELITTDGSFRVQLSLFSGKTLNRVVRLLRSGDAFEVKTPSSTASVRGTVFSVETISDEMSQVTVEEGTVQVAMGDQSVAVEAGFQVTAVLGQELQTVPLARPTAAPTATSTSTRTPTDTPEPTDEPTRRATAVPTEAATETKESGDTGRATPTKTSSPTAQSTPTGDDVQGKVLVCHYPAGDVTKGNTLEIDASALDAHLAHGDLVGECPPPSAVVPTNTPLPPATNTPLPPPTSTPLPAPTDTAVPAPTDTPAAGGKVLVCHNGNTIEINLDALDDHLAHGDTLGACP